MTPECWRWDRVEAVFPAGEPVDPQVEDDWLLMADVSRVVTHIASKVCAMRSIRGMSADVRQEVCVCLHMLITEPEYRVRFRFKADGRERPDMASALWACMDQRGKQIAESGFTDGLSGASLARRQHRSQVRAAAQPGASEADVLAAQASWVGVGHLDEDAGQRHAAPEMAMEVLAGALARCAQLQRVVRAAGMAMAGGDMPEAAAVAKTAGISQARAESLLPLALQMLQEAAR